MKTDADIFQEVFSVGKNSVQMKKALNGKPELQWLFDSLDSLAPCLYDAYDSMFNSDKSMLLYTVGYNAVFAGLAAVISYRSETLRPQDDLFEFLQNKFDLRSLYLQTSELIWPGEGYYPEMDRFLMETDAFARSFLPLVNRLCEIERDETDRKYYKFEYVKAMTLYGGFVYLNRWGGMK